jgi:hypothetical protein
MLSLAARTQNFSTKLTALDDGDRYFHRLSLRGIESLSREVLDGCARWGPDTSLADC